MRAIPALALILAVAQPVYAQEDNGHGKALEEFSQEAQDAFRKLLDALRPELDRLKNRIDDLSNYEMPEILPNGDIIIRRKKTVPPLTPDAPVDL